MGGAFRVFYQEAEPGPVPPRFLETPRFWKTGGAQPLHKISEGQVSLISWEYILCGSKPEMPVRVRSGLSGQQG